MGSWEKERSCHAQILGIFFLLYWIGLIFTDWKSGLILFPGLFIAGYILFYIIPKIIFYSKEFSKKCNHGVFGGSSMKRCQICVKEKEFAEINRKLETQRRIEENRILKEEQNRILNINKRFNELRRIEKVRIKDEFNLKFENIINVNHFEFEYLIARLFQELGYKVRQTPKSNDGGKDLILRMNNDLIFVEVKKNSETNKIGRPIIQKFHSALITGKAKKGLIVTTSYFAQTVYEHPAIKSGEIELIDRDKLRELLVGVFGENNILSFRDICLVCGSEFENRFSKINYCINGHKGEYVTLDNFIK